MHARESGGCGWLRRSRLAGCLRLGYDGRYEHDVGHRTEHDRVGPSREHPAEPMPASPAADRRCRDCRLRPDGRARRRPGPTAASLQAIAPIASPLDSRSTSSPVRQFARSTFPAATCCLDARSRAPSASTVPMNGTGAR